MTNRDPSGRHFTLSGETASTETVNVGIYDVTLTVTDSVGLTASATMVIAVAGVCTEFKPIIDDVMSKLGVEDPNQIVSSIDNLQNQVVAQNETIAGLENQMASLTNIIMGLQGQITMLNGTIAGLESQIALKDQTIDFLQAEIVSKDQTIAAL